MDAGTASPGGTVMRIVAFDLETTGVRPEVDRILEFCFIELDQDLREVGRWGSLVDPAQAIPKEIQELTGITPDMVAGKPGFAAHAARIQTLVQDAILVAHNYEFDLRFLNQELVRAGQPGLKPDHPCIDTVVIERQFVNNKLESVYRRYTGKSLEGAHRSEADTAATVEVLRGQRRVHADALPPLIADLTVTNMERREGRGRERTWLDHDHRFYRDGAGIIRFGFGKYRDMPALEHEDYLLWMRGRDFSAETKAAIDLILRAKVGPVVAVPPAQGPPGAAPAASPNPASAVAAAPARPATA